MLIFLKPQLGGGFDGGGIAGGYVVPTDKKPAKQGKRRVAKPSKILPKKLTPKVIIAAVEDQRVEELKERLRTMTLDLEVELLKQAEAEVHERLRFEALQAQEQAREQYISELLSHMVEEAERELAAEQAEILEILDILDGDAMRALEVHNYTTIKKRRRPFSKA